MSNSFCAVCGKRHRFKGPVDDERDVISSLCLDCHGKLVVIGPYVYACEVCKVKHSSSFGIYCRSNTLTNRVYGVVYDFRSIAVLSKRVKINL